MGWNSRLSLALRVIGSILQSVALAETINEKKADVLKPIRKCEFNLRPKVTTSLEPHPFEQSKHVRHILELCS